ncbi:thymidine phosphorylase-like [Oratosquilla oratoria]|uniref:thymidine phosphorylase-like n=1 Tax=Oratosquilla oratoria TaxID=337810 RepID=UPI003F76F03E
MTGHTKGTDTSASVGAVEVEPFRIDTLLKVKQSGGRFSPAMIEFLVRNIAKGTMEDSQIGAWLMAMYIQGLDPKETMHLTSAMKESGTVLTWDPSWVVGDKHSTGGVGDKTSLPLAPALAACGLKVPMISGRGLGHTGGTLDKLESIPGYRVMLSAEEMNVALQKAGCCIVGQTGSIVPADKRMYAVRDITGTIDSLPLIVASIVSKKAAEGLNTLVLDVKYGRGTFMKTQQEAKDLARALVDTANALNMRTTALITNMDTPIGRTIGNALEVEESIECLRGKGSDDLVELVTVLGGELLASSGLTPDAVKGRDAIAMSLKDGSAMRVFCQMLQLQGVSKDTAEQICLEKKGTSSVLPKASHVLNVRATKAGLVTDLDALALAKVSLALGAGRSKSSDAINHAVGIRLTKVVGEGVGIGDTWAEIHYEKEIPQSLVLKVETAITISKNASYVPTSRITERVH